MVDHFRMARVLEYKSEKVESDVADSFVSKYMGWVKNNTAA